MLVFSLEVSVVVLVHRCSELANQLLLDAKLLFGGGTNVLDLFALIVDVAQAVGDGYQHGFELVAFF